MKSLTVLVTLFLPDAQTDRAWRVSLKTLDLLYILYTRTTGKPCVVGCIFCAQEPQASPVWQAIHFAHKNLKQALCYKLYILCTRTSSKPCVALAGYTFCAQGPQASPVFQAIHFGYKNFK